MVLSKELNEVRAEILHTLSRAAAEGDARKALALGRALEQVERDVQAALAVELRLSRMREDLASIQPPGIPADETLPVRELPAGEGKKAKGNRIRRQFAAAHGLSQVRGVEYRTSTGRQVGIATASEDRRGNRWWLGLPNTDFDVMVLVCEHGGRQLEFVIPRDKLTTVWAKLSRDAEGREIKFNVRRELGNYGSYQLLVTGDQPFDIQPFLGRYELLNGRV